MRLEAVALEAALPPLPSTLAVLQGEEEAREEGLSSSGLAEAQ